MHHPIFGHSFSVIVALILLCGLLFNFLNKKITSVRKNAEEADIGAFGLSTTPTETSSDASNLSTAPIEANNSESSSLTVLTGDRYQVFLSFRGLDTRQGFTSHLYSGLVDAGIHAFKDDNELRQGKEIGPDLLAAIKNSKILIPILSINYGSSKWCLDELVQIMECKNENTGHIVLPIFYKVEPAHMRYQKGSFEAAFQKHESRYAGMILEKWKQALNEVSRLKGWEAKGDEGELVKLVVQEVLSKLKEHFKLVIPENLVGIDSHVKHVMKFVDDNSCRTLFVGIHGMGGIGKTTLAKAIYNKLFDQFMYHSFISDIRDLCKGNRLEVLQNRLIFDILKQKEQVCHKDEGIIYISSNFRGKKVLLLLDDVDDDNQLKALAGNHNWFSSGSRVFITTRKKAVLDTARVDYNYELEAMDVNQSLHLFSRHAFLRDSPPTEFKDLTQKVVSTTGGLPLSLEVLGSFLHRRKQEEWIHTFNKLKTVPHQDVQARLKISYEALDHRQKQLFLDIACLFIGTNKRIASYMWEACGFFPEVEVKVLIFMSLIKIGDNHELKMHDQLRDLGREIVREESQWKPWCYSRLWDFEEILKVLKGNKGTDEVKAIYLNKDSLEGSGKTADQGGDILTDHNFKNLTSLRFLHVRGAQFSGDFKNLFKELKWLTWQNCPLTFEANNFNVEELAVLDLSRSKISDEWRGWSSIMMAKKLKFLDLTRCESLRSMVFPSTFKNLEHLILRDCRRLEKIDSPIGDMKLKHLDLTGCESLSNTVFLSAFKTLEHLILRDCEEVEQIDSSIGEMKSLVLLDLTGCKSLRELPAEVGKLEALEQFFLKDSPNISVVPDIEALQNLKILNTCRTGIKELPIGIGRLSKLQELDASQCKQLQMEMPESFCNLSSLKSLDLHGCKELQLLPDLPSNLRSLSVTCQSRRLPSFSHLTHLKELQLLDCKFLECFQMTDVEESELPKSLNPPFKLEILKIYGCKSMRTLDVSELSHLRILSIVSCNNISVQGLDKLKYLEISRFD